MGYKADVWIDWCPGCGNFGILTSIIKAFEELGLDPSKTVLVSGIGCSSKIPHFVQVNGVHTVHGRAIPFATGIKLANPGLTVVVHGGDGDLLGIGAGHFVALGRRNLDLVVVLHNNGVYGLTKGQASPTLPLEIKTKSMVKPNLQNFTNPVMLALASGYTFVARGYSFEGAHLKNLVKSAIQHKGAAFVDVLQPCVTFNDVYTADFYRKAIYKLEDDPKWDPVVKDRNDASAKLAQAFAKSMEWDEKIPIGVFYVDPYATTLEERLAKYLRSYPRSNPANSKIEEYGKPIINQEIFEKIFRDLIVDIENG